MIKNKTVALGLSGGVDSSVTAFLLQKQGYQVIAYYMRNWSSDLGKFKCPWKEDRDSALRVANHLNIPFYTLNFEKEYKKKVVDYLFKGYQKGITPNPDIMCNKEIKFKIFLEKVIQLGADKIATGHYAQVKESKDGFHLLKGKDKNKDQSYFLYTLNQKQLSKTLFPIGNYTKPQIRKIARDAKLPSANKPDSQGICFIGEVNITELLKTVIKPKKGDIITTEGEKIGEHQGVWYYTIGQRKGIGIGGGVPYFVVQKDLKNNRLIVGKGSWINELFTDYCIIKDIHWINKSTQLNGKYGDKEPKFPLECLAKTRYRQIDQKCTVIKEKNSYKITFKEKQRAITSGQSAVLYQKEECLGGGIIE
jgi:tRNA-uridine 2-sulfurtransferase